jgi:phage portal protein BeeE
VTTSSLSPVLRKPIAYQTISNFLNDAMRNLHLRGNAYALALRNGRFKIEELHFCDWRVSALV